jgi:hypothetical protein
MRTSEIAIARKETKQKARVLVGGNAYSIPQIRVPKDMRICQRPCSVGVFIIRNILYSKRIKTH